jgi:lipid-A-disaccharide synthase-like uncharacterized protein
VQTTDRWLAIGLIGQALFSARFLIQWVVSEKQRRSVTPVAFWYFSVAGGVVLLLYAIHRRDLVFTIGQAAGLLVYARNLMLIRRTPAVRDEPSASLDTVDTTPV